MRSRHLLFSALLLASSCADPASVSDSDSDFTEADQGKGDNFYSSDTYEYFVSGQSQVTIEDDLKDATAEVKLGRARELMDLKNIVIGWFLHVRLVDKEVGDAAHTDANSTSYPGFHGMVRDGQYVDDSLKALSDGLSYSFAFRLQVAGPQDLMNVLPGTLKGTQKTFTLEMGKISNEDMSHIDAESEWFRGGMWDSGSFDPSKLDPSLLETVDLIVERQVTDNDAYPDLQKLVSDGKLDIDLHYGWDYWSRYDISLSRELYGYLTGKGFVSPAASYDKYDGIQGPLTKKISLGGKSVAVNVRIFHGADEMGGPGPAPGTDAGAIEMENRMYASLASSEVVIFKGHAGNYYGFALADWKRTARGALDYPALESAKMPADKYQIVMAAGCQTFSTGQAFRQNTSKPNFANLNVITTTTFSSASDNNDIYGLLSGLFDSTQTFQPITWGNIVGKMNGSTDLGAMFGVHGIDSDPHLSPFARPDLFGKSCKTVADCGGAGNRCTTSSAGGKVCSAVCTYSDACPKNFRCAQVAKGTKIVESQCLK